MSSVFTPIAGIVGMDCYDPVTQDLRPDSNCAKMRDDFNNAQSMKDYANAVIDRIRQRGKYKKET